MSTEHRALSTSFRDGWFVVPYEVAWADCDAIGHVNNVAYFRLFEMARVKFWLEMKSRSAPLDLDFIVARAECDFRLQLNLLDRLEICVRVSEMRTSSFDFRYEVRREGTGEIAAIGTVVAVLFAWEQNTKMAIPADLRTMVDSFQSS